MTTETTITKIELLHQNDYLTAYTTGDHVIVRNPRKQTEWLALRAGEYIHPANAIIIASTRRECLERLGSTGRAEIKTETTTIVTIEHTGLGRINGYLTNGVHVASCDYCGFVGSSPSNLRLVEEIASRHIRIDHAGQATVHYS